MVRTAVSSPVSAAPGEAPRVATIGASRATAARAASRAGRRTMKTPMLGCFEAVVTDNDRYQGVILRLRPKLRKR
jgi:hypothetical protein